LLRLRASWRMAAPTRTRERPQHGSNPGSELTALLRNSHTARNLCALLQYAPRHVLTNIPERPKREVLRRKRTDDDQGRDRHGAVFLHGCLCNSNRFGGENAAKVGLFVSHHNRGTPPEMAGRAAFTFAAPARPSPFLGGREGL